MENEKVNITIEEGEHHCLFANEYYKLCDEKCKHYKTCARSVYNNKRYLYYK
jgi:hypothetical protein